jgi:hypothetical protein
MKSLTRHDKGALLSKLRVEFSVAAQSPIVKYQDLWNPKKTSSQPGKMFNNITSLESDQIYREEEEE